MFTLTHCIDELSFIRNCCVSWAVRVNTPWPEV